MAIREYKQPGKRDSSHGVYDSEPARGLPSSVNPTSQRALDNADSTLDNIDDVLADAERNPSGGAGFYNPQGDSSAPSSSSISEREGQGGGQESQGSSDSRSGAGAASSIASAASKTGAPPAVLMNAAIKLAGSRKGQAGILGGTLGVAIISVLLAALLSLPSLKLQHFVTNWKQIFYANAFDATTNMSDNLMAHYIVKKVVPGMVKNNCTTTRVNKSCADVSNVSNIVGAGYVAWHGANVEGEWAKDGFEIRREVRNGQHRIFLRSSTINGDLDLGTYNASNVATFEGKAFAELKREDVKRHARTLYEDQTKARRVISKYLIGKRLEDKYGVRRCIVACATANAVTIKAETKVIAGKLYLAERVLVPRTEMYGIAVSCAVSGFNCTNPEEADQNGETLSKFERDLQAVLLDYRSKYGSQSLEELEKEADKIRANGFIEYTMKRIAGETVGKTVASSIPIVGWIYLGAQVTAGAQNIGPAVVKMNYVMTSTSAVALATMLATNADEQKTGKVDPMIQASLASQLGEDASADQGGGAAESHPAYNAVMNQGGQTNSIRSAFLPSAYAQEANQVKPYTCDDGKAPPVGSRFCPEEAFGAQSAAGSIATTISKFANNPVFALPGFVANGILSTVSAIAGFFQLDDIIGFITEKITALTPSQVEEVIAWATDKVFGLLFVNPFTEKMSGGREFAMGTLGFATAGSDFAHYGLGGQKLTGAETASILQKQLDERNRVFQERPMYARLFDTQDSQSLVSRIAMSTPTNATQNIQTFGSLALNPFKTMSSVLGSVFSTRQAYADAALYDDIGVTPHGHKPNSVAFTADPEKRYDELGCDNPDNKKAWGGQTQYNARTGAPEHTVTNDCTLYNATVAAGAGIYDSNLIAKGQLESPMSTGSVGAPPSGGGTGLVNGTAQDLAEEILSSGKVDFGSADYRKQVENIAAGNLNICNVNIMILRLVATIAQTHTVTISSLNRYCTGVLTASGTSSYHYAAGGGHAVDFNYVDGVHSNGRTPEELKMLREILPLLPSGSGIGQVNCRTGADVLTMPAGVKQFNDTCNHVHIQVPYQ